MVKFPVGSIVFIPEPTHDHDYITKNIYGFVYDVYKECGNTIYVILCKKERDLYDMRDLSPALIPLSSGVCCQHLDETRLFAALFTGPEKENPVRWEYIIRRDTFYVFCSPWIRWCDAKYESIHADGCAHDIQCIFRCLDDYVARIRCFAYEDVLLG